MAKQISDVFLMDASGLADNTDRALIILHVSRQEVESGLYASVLGRLMVLTDTTENLALYRESMVFMVAGYDNDPRELAEIPEVRAFFRHLAREWPYFLWFLARRMGAIALFASLLCEVSIIRSRQGTGTEFHDLDEVEALFEDLSCRSAPLLGPEGASAALASADAEFFGSAS